MQLAQYANERKKGSLSDDCVRAKFLLDAAPYIHDLLTQSQVSLIDGCGLAIREGREVPAHARVTEVIEIIHRIARDHEILRDYLVHLGAEVVTEEPVPSLSRLRAERQAGFISAPGIGHVTKS